MTSTELVVWGLVLHLVVDWMFQNVWIATNKSDLRHPAGYVHATAHGLVMLLVFPWWAALGLGVAHLVIDSRHPLRLWAKVMDQTEEGPMAVAVHLWRDQTLHAMTIAAAALIVAGAP